jgi:hypothetical protein
MSTGGLSQMRLSRMHDAPAICLDFWTSAYQVIDD